MCFACVFAGLSDTSSSLSLSQFHDFSTTQTTHTEPHICHFWRSGTFSYKPFPSPSVPILTQHITSINLPHTREGKVQKTPHALPSIPTSQNMKFPCFLSVARRRSPTQHQLDQGAPKGQLFSFCILEFLSHFVHCQFCFLFNVSPDYRLSYSLFIFLFSECNLSCC